MTMRDPFLSTKSVLTLKLLQFNTASNYTSVKALSITKSSIICLIFVEGAPWAPSKIKDVVNRPRSVYDKYAVLFA